MTYNPAIHHRRSIRMHGHDYAGGGIYFVTLCAARGAGRVFDPPPMRAMLSRLWQDLPRRFPDMADDAPHAVMPDHFHGLIRLHPGSTSLGDVVCAFKSLADREYRLAVKAADARPAPTAKLWHRNYYERIIRSEHDLRTTTQYIRLNPARLIWPLPLRPPPMHGRTLFPLSGIRHYWPCSGGECWPLEIRHWPPHNHLFRLAGCCSPVAIPARSSRRLNTLLPTTHASC